MTCEYCKENKLGECKPLRCDDWASIFLNKVDKTWFLHMMFYGGEGEVGGGANVRIRHCPMCGRKL